ncbi:virulence RhuM family protein [bacterium]|nr:virulence RhuM family protein [bacterium]
MQFNKGIPTVNEHIKNIYKEKEVDRNSTIRKFRIVQAEGERQVKRDIEFYNLDVIISVGYRVNSKRGTQFRIWATTILKKHLLDGFTVNEKRLQEQDTKIKQLQEKVTLLSRIKSIESVSEEARGIIELMQEFSQALNILDDYDHQKLEIPSGTKKLTYKLTYKKANLLVEQMRKSLKGFPLFGKEKDEGFKSSLGALYQTIGKKDV